MKRLISANAILAALLLYGKVILIPDDFSTIQDGINNSAHLDTVLVKPGIYYENINFSGKNITLASLFLTSNDTSFISQTVIDGSQKNRVVSFANNETENAKLIGFTIRNGFSDYSGAGIYISNSSPEISNNIIRFNIVYWNWYGEGSGMYLKKSKSKIIRNIIRDNYNAYKGGGIRIDSCNTVELTENIFFNNTTFSNLGVSNGGGIDITNSADIVIYRNLMYDNNVDFGDGDMISIISSDVEINKCTLYNISSSGSSIFVYDTQLTMKNSIIWSDINFQGIAIDSSNFKNSSMNISYCNINEATEGEGNIKADPLFNNFEIFTLQLQSPCINRGDPASEFDPDGTITDLGWKYSDMSDYGTVSGIITVSEGLGTLDDVQIKAGEVISKPIESGDYNIHLIPGIYNITATLGLHTSETVSNIVVSSGQEVTGIDFNLNNISTGFKIFVAQDNSADFNTIQEAIDIAIKGDTIVVAEGIYPESLFLYGKSLSLGSFFILNGDKTYIDNTVIQGKEFRLLRIESLPDTTAFICGLTFQDGHEYNAGGIYVKDSSPKFSNCIIRSNTADYKGGGVWNYRSNTVFENCTFSNNQASGGGGMSNEYSDVKIKNCTIDNNSAMSGGGIHNYYSSPVISNSVISYNTAEGGDGGGIDNLYESHPQFINNIISFNSSVWGGGLYFKGGADAVVLNNLIINNSAEKGGGIYCRWANPQIVNNTISFNSASQYGGGIDFYDRAEPDLYNNIIWGNSAPTGLQISLDCGYAQPDFYFCDIQGGKEEFYYYDENSPVLYTGDYINNIDLDPLFLDEWNGDYFLTENSPCIDAGTVLIPDSISFPEFDLAHNARIYGSTIDIGAYEWQNVGIENNSLPLTTELYQNYPNPFNPVTKINYSLSEASQVELNVYNINGQLVRNLVNSKIDKGNHSVQFNADDLTTGLYFCSFKVDGVSIQTRKMMLLK